MGNAGKELSTKVIFQPGILRRLQILPNGNGVHLGVHQDITLDLQTLFWRFEGKNEEYLLSLKQDWNTSIRKLLLILLEGGSWSSDPGTTTAHVMELGIGSFSPDLENNDQRVLAVALMESERSDGALERGLLLPSGETKRIHLSFDSDAAYAVWFVGAPK